MARAILELIGDPDSLLKSFKKSSAAADKFGKDLKQLSVTAEQSARAQIEAATRRDARLRQEISTYRQVASAAQKGSREQVAAANLATRAEERLARSLAVTSREAKEHARSVAKSEKELSRFGRGAAAGSGLASGLGRSLAFASGGFLATASITGILRASIEQGSQAAATQKQLAAQFDASGKSLERYQSQIDAATFKVSRLAGIEDDDLKRAFVTAFRGTNDVTRALRIQAIAADVARGRHIELSAATLALTKAYGGQATALRRLGILVPPTLHGMDALNFVARKFAGQAAAGTTQQERFGAAIKNTEEIIGLALLPQFNKMLASLTKWLSKSENQARIQKDVAKGARVIGNAFAVTAHVIGATADAVDRLNKAFDKIPGHSSSLRDLFNKIPGHGISGLDLLHAFGGGGESLGSGSSRRLRRGASPIGENALSGAGLVIGSAKAAGPLGFKARFAVAELALARAQLTKAQADDKKILQLEAALLRERIKTLGTSRKTLGKRTEATQQLVGIESQITSIEQDASSKVDTARKKRLSAEQKVAREAYRLRTLALRNEAQRLAREKSADTKELAALKQRDRALTSKIKAIQSNFKSALDTARQGIGDLFGGPVLNFSDEQRKAALGIPNTAADPKALVKDLNAQVRQASVFQRNLARLSKRGAPSSLVKELQAGGQANATQVAALAGASRGTLKEFFKAFGAREKLVQNIAHAQMRAQLVTLHADRVRLTSVRGQEIKVEVEIKGVSKDQAKVRVKQSAAQRRGPVPGRS